MPMHDWTTVDAGIFHDFHQEWARSIKHALNGGLLPSEYYALIEQTTLRGDWEKSIPDVLALEATGVPDGTSDGAQTALLARPQSARKIISALDLYRRKKNVVSIRHVTDDRVVAMIEIVSPGNKSGRAAFQDFLAKIGHLLARGIHFLVLDPFLPTRRDPAGFHGAFLQDIDGLPYELPVAQPLTFASYEANPTDDFYADVKHLAFGDALPDMPVFLETNGCVMVPLEETYQSAWLSVPQRWRQFVAGSSNSGR